MSKPASDSPPADHELREWSEWSTATISDANSRAGAMTAAISALTGYRLLGRAFPIHVLAGDSATSHQAISAAPPGCVLVIDGDGYEGRAIWGEVLTVAARAKGVQGAVVDGVVRDIDAIRQLGFPLFARGTTPGGPHKSGGGYWGKPVSCGGVLVAPGDLVAGDGDGVAVVPWDKRDEVAEAVVARLAFEKEAMNAIAGGIDSATYFAL